MVHGQPTSQIFCNKAGKVLGLLYCKYYHDSHTDTLLHLYKMLVHPLLEYTRLVSGIRISGRKSRTLKKCKLFAHKICLKEWYINYDVLVETASIPANARKTETVPQAMPAV